MRFCPQQQEVGLLGLVAFPKFLPIRKAKASSTVEDYINGMASLYPLFRQPQRRQHLNESNA